MTTRTQHDPILNMEMFFTGDSPYQNYLETLGDYYPLDIKVQWDHLYDQLETQKNEWVISNSQFTHNALVYKKTGQKLLDLLFFNHLLYSEEFKRTLLPKDNTSGRGEIELFPNIVQLELYQLNNGSFLEFPISEHRIQFLAVSRSNTNELHLVINQKKQSTIENQICYLNSHKNSSLFSFSDNILVIHGKLKDTAEAFYFCTETLEQK